MINIMTVDVEDWYHGLANIYRAEKCEKRLLSSVQIILDLFEKYKVSATFFMLGKIAEEYADLAGVITDRGHEIGCHGHEHKFITQMGRNEFENALSNATRILEKDAKKKILSFRAPYFSLTEKNPWVLDVLEKYGYRFDSSVFPVKHPLYGVPDAPSIPYRVSSGNLKVETKNSKILEFPILVNKTLGMTFGAGGGAYLRFWGTRFVKKSIKKINAGGHPATLYVHPWEFDKFIPDIDIPRYYKFIQFYKVGRMSELIEPILKEFRFSSMSAVGEAFGF